MQNMFVRVTDDFEALEALLRRNDVTKHKEQLVSGLGAAGPQAIASSSFAFDDLNACDLLVVCIFESLLVEFGGIPLALVQLDCVAV